MTAVVSSARRRKPKVEGRRNGAVVTPHVYGFKRMVWGQVFTFGYDLPTATARCLRLLALKSEQQGQRLKAWTPETRAQAWRIAKGEEGEQSEQAASPRPRDAQTLNALAAMSEPFNHTEAPASQPAAKGQPTFYNALDAYVAQLETADHAFPGRVKAQRRALADMPLTALGERELRQLVRHWKSKPKATHAVWVERQGRKVVNVVEAEARIGALSVKKYVQAARQFFTWLGSADSAYDWKAPLNLSAIFRLTNADVQNLKGDAERIAEVVAMNDPDAMHFRHEELRALWDACGISKLRSSYFLLALNLSASTSEIANLKLGDCYLEGDNAAKPFVAFIRNKTKRHNCYGKWFLWSETADMLRTQIAKRKAAGKGKATDLVFVTEDGNPLVTLSPGGFRNDSVKLVWKGWAKAAKVERLSWKNLRKTSSQLVREAATALGMSGDYMADLHTAHKQGAMSLRYNRRADSEWEQLGRCLAEVRKRLPFLDKTKTLKVSSAV